MQIESREDGDGPYGKLGSDIVTRKGYEAIHVSAYYISCVSSVHLFVSTIVY